MRGILTALAFAGLSAAPAAAQTAHLETPAHHLVIMDGATGIQLHCDDCETPIPPASMSKLMTANFTYRTSVTAPCKTVKCTPPNAN